MKSGRIGWFLGGLFGGVLLVALAAFVYLRFGPVPVAVADSPLPFERAITHVALHARIARQEPASSPVAKTPDHLAAGAAVYSENCAFCHGVPHHPSAIGANMYPRAPQLWRVHKNGVVGVSDDPVGATYWRVKNGIRLAGMPSYEKLLSEQQMWQVSLLLASAADPLPEEVQKRLVPPMHESGTEKP